MKNNLTGKVLIAMPSLRDPRFAYSLVYICVHSYEGAMGLILNKSIADLPFSDLLDQLSIKFDSEDTIPNIDVQFGGPVEMGRGFILHSADYTADETTLKVSDTLGLTGTIDILRAIAEKNGPRQSMLALGYAGWAEGQLESEVRNNDWLFCDPDDDLVFSSSHANKWRNALKKIGVNPEFLVSVGGRA